MMERLFDVEEKYMLRAIEVARLGMGYVSPNPMVGCVIVHNGIIIGEGYHREYGKSHAEVNAVNSVLNKELLKDSTLYVTLEQTADGFIDIDRSYEQYCQSTWITNDLSRIAVHKMRADESAILVGTNTARKDNPSLTVREWNGKAPLRLVIDKGTKLPAELALFDQSIPTVVYTSKEITGKDNLEFKRILFNGNELDQILNDLYERGIQSLIVEGGQILLKSFIGANVWDEARVYTGKCYFHHGVKAPAFDALTVKSEELDDSWMFVFHKV